MECFVFFLVFTCGLLFATIFSNVSDHRRLRRLAEERRGETVCHFARSLDYRRLDTKIMRAVYERFREYLPSWFPVRASDDLDETYRIDREDLDDMAYEIADRCGRSMDASEQNPYYGKVSTVSDLIEFLCALPKVQGQ